MRASGGLPVAAASALSGELPTEHRGDVEHLAHVVRQRLRQPLDEFADAARDVEQSRSPRRAGRELPVRRHLAKHLVQEERIAFGRVAQRVDERAGRPHAPGAFDELTDVGFAKPSQRQHQTLALGFGDERGELRQMLDFDLAVGADDRRPHRPDLPRHGDEHHERGWIGRVQVVEDDEQRLRLGGAAHERGDRIEQAEPGLFGLRQLGARRLRQAANPLANFWRDLRDLGGVGPEPACERGEAPRRRSDAATPAPRASKAARLRAPSSDPIASARLSARRKPPLGGRAGSCRRLARPKSSKGALATLAPRRSPR